MKQTCKKCKIEKEIEEFTKEKQNKSGHKGTCKLCIKKYRTKYRKNNSANLAIKSKKYRQENKKKLSEYNKVYGAKYRTLNKEAAKNYSKEYRKTNKLNIRETQNKYQRERLKKDPLFKLKRNLRNRIWVYLKRKKSKTTEDLIGASYGVVKKHIESTFTEGMSWENYGKWHVDHIIPLASAKTEEDLHKLFYYTNLQALWAFDNLSKSDKILTVF